MDYFLFSGHHQGTLAYLAGGLSDAPALRIQPQDSNPRTEGSCDLTYPYDEPLLASHFGRDCRPMQDAINSNFQRSNSSPYQRIASIFPAQHQAFSHFTSTIAPLLCYPPVSNKENYDSLHSSGHYLPTVSCTSQYTVHGRPQCSSAALLSSPFTAKGLASPLSLSSPLKCNKPTRLLSPISYFSDGSFAFMKDIGSPVDNLCLSAWPSSDPDFSPVIRAHPASSKDIEPLVKSNGNDEACSEICEPAAPTTPRRQKPTGLGGLSIGSRLTPSTPTGDNVQIDDGVSLSPLTPLTSCSSFDESPDPASCKRRLMDSSPSPLPRKKRRCSRLSYSGSSLRSPNDNSIDGLSCPQYTIRSFPGVEVSLDFPLFYRRYPLSTYVQLGSASSPCSLFGVKHPGGNYNPPRSACDLYTPRFVRGKGIEKVGLCPICIESPRRGGCGRALWLAMKFSAFKCVFEPCSICLSPTHLSYSYHMQYSHGVSASTGHPFAPPTAFKTINRPNAGKKEKACIRQGKCHKCLKWVAIEGIKAMENKVKEIYWWKHAAACHQGSSTKNNNVYEKDFVYQRLLDCGALEI